MEQEFIVKELETQLKIKKTQKPSKMEKKDICITILCLFLGAGVLCPAGIGAILIWSGYKTLLINGMILTEAIALGVFMKTSRIVKELYLENKKEISAWNSEIKYLEELRQQEQQKLEKSKKNLSSSQKSNLNSEENFQQTREYFFNLREELLFIKAYEYHKEEWNQYFQEQRLEEMLSSQYSKEQLEKIMKYIVKKNTKSLTRKVEE